jgi:hypothetical protein
VSAKKRRRYGKSICREMVVAIVLNPDGRFNFPRRV